MESTIDQPSLKRPRDSSSPENVGEADGDLSTSKQPRVPQEQQPATQTGTNDEGLGTGESRKEGPPPYGSQQYWEDRYRAQFADIERSVNKEEVSLDQQQVTVSDCDADGSFKLTTSQGDCPDPFHAWYFNYEELQPILLPLILGDNADAAQHDEISSDEEGGNEGPDNDGSSAGNPPKEMTSRNELSKEEKEGSNAVSTNDDSNKDWEGFEEVGSESEEEDETPIRAGLARDGPIAVLEVGCGDVPLGRDLAIGIEKLPVQDIPEIKDMEKDATDPTLVKPTMILQKVVCIDYSETVIQAMKAHQKQRESMIKAGEGESSDPVSKQATFNPTIPIEYHVADARDLPYPDKSYQLILEKGTLDAMLSDHEKGRSNCIAIVKECARVLSIGGALLVVSHLNAHVPSGMKWLDEVLIPGLRQGGGDCEWELEVHGNGDDRSVGQRKNPSAKNDGEDGSSVSSQEEESPGPAVYIAHKRPPPLKPPDRLTSAVWANQDTSSERSRTDDDNKPDIPLRFFTY